MDDDFQTIFALSSGAPPAAIGIIRISGSRAREALHVLTGTADVVPRRASLRWLRDPRDGRDLDRALLLWFPGPRTATGEDIAELHIHGGRAVGDAVLAALAAIPGLRPALAGEFTRRAFANGVIDLAEAEGLGDLLAAETESQRRHALALAGGALSRHVDRWQRDILALAARVEALLDFADEDDVREDGDALSAQMAALHYELDAILRQPPVERLRDGIRVVLAGPPNAGKSTLLNALVGRDAAIISPVPGTTRDLIEAPVAIGGIAFLFTDTAGLREAEGEIESIGIDRAEQAMRGADIILWLGAPADCPDRSRAITLHARADQPDRLTTQPQGADLAISAVTGLGLAALKDQLAARAAGLLPRENEVALNRRQREALADCASAIADGARQADLVLLAETLRSARAALDRLTGRAGVEDMLDLLFGQFCIGK